MEQLIVGLLIWISQHSSFHYDPAMGLPDVKHVSQYELAELYVGKASRVQGLLSEADKESVYNSLAKSLEAVYAADKTTIYLGDKIDPRSTYGRSVLIHELIHFLQDKNNMHQRVACTNALEKDAYLIQSDYMVQNNICLLYTSPSPRDRG